MGKLAVVPDKITEYNFSLRDRNPQTWVPNIYKAKAEDFQKAKQRIYRSKSYPTRITLPVNLRKN